MAVPEFIYIGDPMCSWCYGFTPVLEALKYKFGGRADFTLRVGGLRPGDQAEPMHSGMAAMLRHHWEAVRERSGQPFDFEFLERKNFLYDTEPSCRAVVTARTMDFSKAYDFFWKVQKAFYAGNQDPTDLVVFKKAAEECGLDSEEFARLWAGPAMREATQEDFVETRRWGVAGYPTVLLRDGKELAVLSRGYMEVEVLGPRLEAWLEGVKTAG
jgi:putative protein-disulfide isomerase